MGPIFGWRGGQWPLHAKSRNYSSVRFTTGSGRVHWSSEHPDITMIIDFSGGVRERVLRSRCSQYISFLKFNKVLHFRLSQIVDMFSKYHIKFGKRPKNQSKSDKNRSQKRQLRSATKKIWICSAGAPRNPRFFKAADKRSGDRKSVTGIYRCF